MILDSIAHHTRVYAYNRPGYGRSNQKDTPHTVKEVAHQLHANLFAKKIPPPYILVGHAAGGLFMNMFARLYPEEIAGVVLIDPIHPDQYEYLKNNENTF